MQVDAYVTQAPPRQRHAAPFVNKLPAYVRQRAEDERRVQGSLIVNGLLKAFHEYDMVAIRYYLKRYKFFENAGYQLTHAQLRLVVPALYDVVTSPGTSPVYAIQLLGYLSDLVRSARNAGTVGIVLPHRPLMWLAERLTAPTASNCTAALAGTISACRAFFAPEAAEAATLALCTLTPAAANGSSAHELFAFFVPTMVHPAHPIDNVAVAAALLRVTAMAYARPTSVALPLFTSLLYRACSDRVGAIDTERIPTTLEGLSKVRPEDLMVGVGDDGRKWSLPDDTSALSTSSPVGGRHANFGKSMTASMAASASIDGGPAPLMPGSTTVHMSPEDVTALVTAHSERRAQLFDGLSSMASAVICVKQYDTGLTALAKRVFQIAPGEVLSQYLHALVWTVRDLSLDSGSTCARLCECVVSYEASESPPADDFGAGSVIVSIAVEFDSRLQEQGNAPGTMRRLRRYCPMAPHAWLTSATAERVASCIVRIASPMVYHKAADAQENALHSLAVMLPYAPNVDILRMFPLIVHGIGAMQPPMRVAGMDMLRRCLRTLGAPYHYPLSPEPIRAPSVLLRALYDPDVPSALFDDGKKWAKEAAKMAARSVGKPVKGVEPYDVPSYPAVPAGVEKRWGWGWKESPYDVLRAALKHHAAFAGVLPAMLDCIHSALDVNASSQVFSAIAVGTALFVSIPLDWEEDVEDTCGCPAPVTAAAAAAASPSSPGSPGKSPKEKNGGEWVPYGLRSMPPVPSEAVSADVRAALDEPYIQAALDALPEGHHDRTPQAKKEILNLAHDVDDVVQHLRVRLPQLIERFADRMWAYVAAQRVRPRPFGSPGTSRAKRPREDRMTVGFGMLAAAFLCNLNPNRRRQIVKNWVREARTSTLAGTQGLALCAVMLVSAARALTAEDAATLIAAPLLDDVLQMGTDEAPELLPDEAIQRFYLLAVVLRVGGVAVTVKERVLQVFKVWFKPILLSAMENRADVETMAEEDAIAASAFSPTANRSHVEVAHVYLKFMRGCLAGLTNTDVSFPPPYARSNAGGAEVVDADAVAPSTEKCCESDTSDSEGDAESVGTEGDEADIGDKKGMSSVAMPAVVLQTSAHSVAVEWRIPTAEAVETATAIYDLVSDLVANALIKALKAGAATYSIGPLPSAPADLEEDLLSGRAMARCFLARTATDLSALQACWPPGVQPPPMEEEPPLSAVSAGGSKTSVTDGVRTSMRMVGMLLDAALPILPSAGEGGVFSTAHLSPAAAAAVAVDASRPNDYHDLPGGHAVRLMHQGVINAAVEAGRLKWSPAAFYALMTQVATLSEVYHRTLADPNAMSPLPGSQVGGGRSRVSTFGGAISGGEGVPTAEHARMLLPRLGDRGAQGGPSAARGGGDTDHLAPPSALEPLRSAPTSGFSGAFSPGLRSPMLPGFGETGGTVTPWFAEPLMLRWVVSALRVSHVVGSSAGLASMRLKHSTDSLMNCPQGPISRTLALLKNLRSREAKVTQWPLDGIVVDTILGVTALVSSTRGAVDYSLLASTVRDAADQFAPAAVERAMWLSASPVIAVARQVARMQLPFLSVDIPTDAAAAVSGDVGAADSFAGVFGGRGSHAVELGVQRCDGQPFVWTSRAPFPTVWGGAEGPPTNGPRPSFDADDPVARERFLDGPCRALRVPRLPGWYSLIPHSYSYITNVCADSVEGAAKDVGGRGRGAAGAAALPRSDSTDSLDLLPPTAPQPSRIAVNLAHLFQCASMTSALQGNSYPPRALLHVMCCAAAAFTLSSVAEQIARESAEALGYSISQANEQVQVAVSGVFNLITKLGSSGDARSPYWCLMMPESLLGLPTLAPHMLAASAREMIKVCLGEKVLRSLEAASDSWCSVDSTLPRGEEGVVGTLKADQMVCDLGPLTPSATPSPAEGDIMAPAVLQRQLLDVHHTVAARVLVLLTLFGEGGRRSASPPADMPYAETCPAANAPTLVLQLASMWAAYATPNVREAAVLYVVSTVGNLMSGRAIGVVPSASDGCAAGGGDGGDVPMSGRGVAEDEGSGILRRPRQSSWSLYPAQVEGGGLGSLEKVCVFDVQKRRYVTIAGNGSEEDVGGGMFAQHAEQLLSSGKHYYIIPAAVLPGPVLSVYEGPYAPKASHAFALPCVHGGGDVVSSLGKAVRSLSFLQSADSLKKLLWSLAASDNAVYARSLLTMVAQVLGPTSIEAFGGTPVKIVDAGIAARVAVSTSAAAPAGAPPTTPKVGGGAVGPVDPSSRPGPDQTVAAAMPDVPGGEANPLAASMHAPPELDVGPCLSNHDDNSAVVAADAAMSPTSPAVIEGLIGPLRADALDESVCCSVAAGVAAAVLVASLGWSDEDAARGYDYALDILVAIVQRGSINAASFARSAIDTARFGVPIFRHAVLVAFAVELGRKGVAGLSSVSDSSDRDGTPAAVASPLSPTGASATRPVAVLGVQAEGDGVVATSIRTARAHAERLLSKSSRSFEQRSRYLALLQGTVAYSTRSGLTFAIEALVNTAVESVEVPSSEALRSIVASPSAADALSPTFSSAPTAVYFMPDDTTAAAFEIAGVPMPSFPTGGTFRGADFSNLFAAPYDVLRSSVAQLMHCMFRMETVVVPVQQPTVSEEALAKAWPFLSPAQLDGVPGGRGVGTASTGVGAASLPTVSYACPPEALPLLRWLVIGVIGSTVTAIEAAAATSHSESPPDCVLVPVPPFTKKWALDGREPPQAFRPEAAQQVGFVKVRVSDVASIAQYVASMVDSLVKWVPALPSSFCELLLSYLLRLSAATYRNMQELVVRMGVFWVYCTSVAALLPVRRLILFGIRLMVAAVDPDLRTTKGIAPSVLRALDFEKAIGDAYAPDPMSMPHAFLAAAETAVSVGGGNSSWRARVYLLNFLRGVCGLSYADWPASESSRHPTSQAGRDSAPLVGLMLGAGKGPSTAYVAGLPFSVAADLTPSLLPIPRPRSSAARQAKNESDEVAAIAYLSRYVSGAATTAASRLLFDPRAEVRAEAREFVKAGTIEIAACVRDSMLVRPMLESLPGGVDGTGPRVGGTGKATLYAVRTLTSVLLASKQSIPSYVPSLMERLAGLSHSGSNEVVAAIRESFAKSETLWWKDHQEMWELGGSERFSEMERDAVKELVYAPSFYA